MTNLFKRKGMFLAAALAAGMFSAASASAAIIISEVDSAGSGTGTATNPSYAEDWFEITNTGQTAVDLTGWKMDDNSASFSLAVPLANVTSIAAGQSVVFLEDTGTSYASDTALNAAFEAAWFGSNVPAGLTIGNYGGKGVGLSQTADAVNLYNASGVLQAGVSFNASPANGATFDNSAGLSGLISTPSVLNVNGAFNSVTGGEIGSPGVAPVPLPAAAWLLVSGLGMLPMVSRRRKRV